MGGLGSVPRSVASLVWLALGLQSGCGKSSEEQHWLAARVSRCSFGGVVSPRLQRFRASVAASARLGFDVLLLGRALADAEFYADLWKGFLPDLGYINSLKAIDPANPNYYHFHYGTSVLGTIVFIEQLLREELGATAGTEPYCLYAHLMAVFVRSYFAPLVSICQQRRLAKQCNGRSLKHWLLRARWGSRRSAWPAVRYEEARMSLVAALLLLGGGRELDHTRFLDWPVGASELSELLEVFLTVCHWPRGRAGCLVGDLYSAARSRLKMLHGLDGARRLSEDALQEILRRTSVQADGWHVMATRDLVHRAVHQGDGVVGSRITLKVLHLGTHGAFLNMIKASCIDAEAHARLGFDLDFMDVQSSDVGLYQADAVHETRQRWDPDEDAVKSFVLFELVDHSFIIVSRHMRSRVSQLLATPVVGATVCMCTIPFVTCAAFAELDCPVIYYGPTTPVVQFPSSYYPQLLGIFRSMALNPRNQFLTNTLHIRHLTEYSTGLALPILPMPCLHTKASYSGSSSRDVLVRDRNSAGLFFTVLRAVARRTYPFRFVHYVETDRSFAAFASHRAVVYVPYTPEGQLSFFELYSMNIPILFPTMLSRYVWPRLGLTFLHTKIPDFRVAVNRWAACYKYQTEFGGLRGRHRLVSRSEPHLSVDYTVSCSGDVAIHTADWSWLGGTRASERARLVPLPIMDRFGNTLALVPRHDVTAGLKSHGGRCVRVSSIMTGWGPFLQVDVGPLPGTCKDFDRPGACTEGVIHCPKQWINFEHVNSSTNAVPERLVLDGVEKGGSFGSTHAFLGSSAFARRRRGTTSPYDLRSHRRHREHSIYADIFQYPGVIRFGSASELMWQLV